MTTSEKTRNRKTTTTASPEENGPRIIRPPAPSTPPRIPERNGTEAPVAAGDELKQALSILGSIAPGTSAANRTSANARAAVLVEVAKARTEQARLAQERIGNLLALAALNGEEADLASAEAACLLLTEEPEVALRLRRYCEEVQVAGSDYHAPLTAGAVVNILAGREPDDDGPLIG